MPSDGERLHGFTVVSRALTLARQLLLPAILGGASVGNDFATTIQWIAIILAIPSIALAFAQWLVFRYRVVDDDLVIDSGLLSRRRRVIPLARLQNIDLEQTALERLAGVAQLRMETASGGGETEASLAVLSLVDA
ncbi:MAG: PH domain-containing protein, partial [Gemmatimonadota bacterium]